MRRISLRKIMLGMALGTAVFSGIMSEKVSCAATTNDVIPPYGRLSIEGGTTESSNTLVEGKKIKVHVYALDNSCADSEILYSISQTPFGTSSTIDTSTWNHYVTGGVSHEITLDSSNSNGKLYLALADKSGNTSIIYDTSVTYTLNYYISGSDTTTPFYSISGTYGVPVCVTNQKPTNGSLYFKGWSTSPTATVASYNQEDVIPPSAFSVSSTNTISLYGVWGESTDGLSLLADVVTMGDYVDYPVYYDTAMSACTYTGWRVLSVDSTTGEVQLVSAGVPLTFYHPGDNAASKIALTTNFLTTALNPSGSRTYRASGLIPFLTLTEVFTNKYTKTESDVPVVRSMTLEDIETATDQTITTTGDKGLSNNKYNNLFKINVNYWLASPYLSNTGSLWLVNTNGDVGSNSSTTYRCAPRSFSEIWTQDDR